MAGENDIRKILVRSTNWLGDAVMSVPALRELSRIFPEAEIHLHARNGVEELFIDADFIDGCVTTGSRPSRIGRIIAGADAISAEDFDLAVLFPNSFESALTATLARIPHRIGYNKDLRGLLLTDPIAVPEWKTKRHEVFYYLHLVSEVEQRYLGRGTVGTSEPDISVPISEERRSAAEDFLRSRGLDPARPLIALGAGSTNSMAKRWPAERFAALADGLNEKLGAQVFLVGAPSEKYVGPAVTSLSKHPPVDLIGKTNISEVAAILSCCDLLVSNDMGLAHVAPAVGAKVVVIFGPTDPVTTRPFSERAMVVSRNVECSPCMLRECPIDHRCMNWVSADEVLSVCLAALRNTTEQ